MQLDGRVALVTGGAEGIGRGIAKRFVDEGARVMIADLNAGQGEQTAKEIGACFVPCDVRTQASDAVASTIAAFGTLDVLVNNAWGGGELSRVENKTRAGFDSAFGVGFFGPYDAMRAAFPVMKAKGWGRIISMCSLNGVNAHIGSVEYNAAKEALRTLTRTAAREWAATGIVANVICPAAVSAALERVTATNPEIGEMAAATNPMGRMGDPYDDVAPVAVFLASEGARYLTGNTLFVDGGSHINGLAWAPELPA
ncbi:MAG: dehydrogenase, short-chain alcohol dehydrogenase like protein [Frankiales bacterium]|nr:dehydrogenase, short-chain alcohol dehydrogenase like protein [Frankiales bacterium]